jgi:trans-2,3-dihydro-3-hydroxyanthranilate isomerase
MKLPFAILDVFISRDSGFSGNQLALVPEAAGLSAETMQEIAREFHFSETVFLTGRARGGFAARIFTPGREVPFAGHPSLGAAFYIRERVMKAPIPVALDLPAGRTLILEDERSSEELLWLMHREPEFFPPVDGESRLADLAAGLGVEAEDVDRRFPTQPVSTGLAHLLVPLRDAEAVRRACPSPEKLKSFFASGEALGVFVFSALDGPGRLLTRMFAPHLGIAEDPATGSAAGCLGAWLSEHRFFGSAEVDAVAEQGASVQRPSLIAIKAEPADGHYNLRVGGKTRIVAEGELEV